MWHKTGEMAVRPLELAPERIKELEDHLMLFYTGPRKENRFSEREAWKTIDDRLAGRIPPDIPQDNTERLQTLANMVKDGVNILTSDDDINRVRRAGHGDAEIAEVVAVVAWMTFSNYFNHVAGTDVDFPAVPAVAAT